MSIPDITEQLENLDHALSASELARILGLHRLTVYKLARSGQLPHFRIANLVRFDGRVVARYLREHEVRG